MDTKRVWLPLGAVVILGTIALWIAKKAPAPADDGDSAVRQAALELEEPPSATQPAVEASAETGAAQAVSREEVVADPAKLHGRVLSVAGAPLPRARVSWVAWDRLDLEWEPAWQVDDWGSLERASVEVLTDERGGFRFDDEVYGDQGTVLWATHPDHVAGCLLLSAEAPLEPAGWTLQLEPASSAFVRVVDADGQAVHGAHVEQYGVTPAQSVRGTGGITLERARRLLVRRFETDPTGVVRLGPFPGDQVLIASRGQEQSAPWRGHAQGEIVLHLSGTFTIDGTVRFPDWSHLNYQGERRLLVQAHHGRDSSTLLSMRPILDGEWGPLSVPILDGASYSLRLEGSPIIPVVEGFAAPSPEAHLHFDLRPGLGHALSFYVEDEQGNPIGDAEVASYWEEDGRERVLRRRALDDGYIDNWSFPDGAVVRSLVSAPGFGSQWAETVLVPEAQQWTHRVVLEKAAALRGRCIHDGKPLQDFEVVAWKPGRSEFSQIAHSFSGRADGAFEIDDVPAGELQVTASSASLPFCKPVHVVVPSEREVVLQLQDPVLGVGQTVDLETGEPVADAQIHVIGCTAEGALRPWGQPHGVDREGRFSILGFSQGRNIVRIVAPGYAEREVHGTASDSDRIDFGRIPLYRAQSLKLRLVSEGPIDFTAVTAEGGLGTFLPRNSFNRDGIVRFDGVSAGTRYVMLEGTPQATWIFLRLELEHGKDWSFSHKVSGRRRLTAEIVGESEERSSFKGLAILFVNRDGVEEQWGLPVPSDGFVSVEGVDADSAMVAIMGPLRTLTATLAVLEGDELHARLDLAGRALLLRVVDKEGAPVPGADVRLYDSGVSSLLYNSTTDSEGTCRFRGLPERSLLATVEHETRGRCIGVPVDGAAEAAEVVLSNVAGLDLRLLDGVVPLPGVQAKALITPIGPRWSMLGSSNEQGRVLATDLTEGVYHITTDHPDCWPTTIDASATPDPSPMAVQVRRRGSLVLQPRNPDGLPLSSCAIELTSIEFDADVASWLEEGLVSSRTGLVSDLGGEIRIERLPRGPYHWAVATSDGGKLEGTCEVLPGKLVQVPMVVP